MIDLNKIEKLIPAHPPIEHLSTRKPEFWQRYEGTADTFDFDLELLARYDLLFHALFEHYFRVQVRGAENIPAEGPVILAGNHSGTIPIDAPITFEAALQHSTPRRLRYLVLPWVKQIPVLWEQMRKLGAVEASFANALNLLGDGEIVGIYPEAERAMAKNWSQRYKLVEFDPGFVKLAIATQSPIVPVITIGAEETYPNFGNWKAMAKLTDMPIFPVTLTFPWLPFPLMFTPMPARWFIKFGKPIRLNYSPDKSFDTVLVKKISDEIRDLIQTEMNSLVAKRRSLISGWDERVLDVHELNFAQTYRQVGNAVVHALC